MVRTRPNDVFKNRVRAIKDQLPKNVQEVLVKKYPEYDTAKAGMLLRNVLLFISADIRLTEILEEIAADYQASLNINKESA